MDQESDVQTPKATGKSRVPKRPDKAPKRDRADWVQAARKVLIADGVDRVKVEPLARILRVTTGSFYHHFRTRDELLEALLRDWEVENNDPIFAAVAAAGDDPMAQFDALWDNGIWGGLYDAAYDSAVRAWARGSKDVQQRVRAIDDLRIALLQSMFVKLGYDELRAFIRARIAYFHQVGYQAMDIIETTEERTRLSPLYDEVLIGAAPGSLPAGEGGEG